MSNIFICLDNIRSLYNVGSVFRSAEFFGLKNIILLGYTGTLVKNGEKIINPKVYKTSLGTEKHLNIILLNDVDELHDFAVKNNLKIISVEQYEGSVNLEKWTPEDNVILVLGNEKTGVDIRILEISEEIVEIARKGTHQSLNVEVTAGIIMNKIASINPN